jgi:hypothetical protein
MDNQKILIASQISQSSNIPIEDVLLLKKSQISFLNKTILFNIPEKKEVLLKDNHTWELIKDLFYSFPNSDYLFYNE